MLKRIWFILILMILNICPAFADQEFINRPDVKKFIQRMVQTHHFNQSELMYIFKSAKLRPAVIRSLKAPLEKKPWYTYQLLFVTEWRIREGAIFWNLHHEALERAEKIYGVPASLIVATIGLETKYGHSTGGYRVVDALVNLGFSNSSRAPFFRHELEEFLLLTREQHLDPLKVTGSYAGAIGQPQFMPSSYRHYAVNFSGHPTIDLSNNETDVIGSVANYYHQHGWQYNQPVAIPASLKNSKFEFFGKKSDDYHFSQMDLAKYGITTRNHFLPNQKLKLIELQGYFGKEYWISFHNFDVIKSYNPSDLYAMAVYQLSYYISQVREKLNNG